jgi:hypothetical protein
MELGAIPPRYRLRVKQRLAILRYVQEHSLLGAAGGFRARLMVPRSLVRARRRAGAQASAKWRRPGGESLSSLRRP